MNYFYAQVEERDNPTLKTVPVVVGGNLMKEVVLLQLAIMKQGLMGFMQECLVVTQKNYSRLLSQLRISNFRNKSTLNSKLLKYQMPLGYAKTVYQTYQQPPPWCNLCLYLFHKCDDFFICLFLHKNFGILFQLFHFYYYV